MFQRPSKAKGVSGLIEVENPNRVVKKNKKLTNQGLDNLGEGEKPQLSRYCLFLFYHSLPI